MKRNAIFHLRVDCLSLAKKRSQGRRRDGSQTQTPFKVLLPEIFPDELEAMPILPLLAYDSNQHLFLENSAIGFFIFRLRKHPC